MHDRVARGSGSSYVAEASEVEVVLTGQERIPLSAERVARELCGRPRRSSSLQMIWMAKDSGPGGLQEALHPVLGRLLGALEVLDDLVAGDDGLGSLFR